MSNLKRKMVNLLDAAAYQGEAAAAGLFQQLLGLDV